MTTTQLQLRRDSTANIDGVTPAQGEPIYDVTRKALVLGDGATVGGLCVTPFAGTWTPTLAGSSTAGTPTYTTQHGDYVQIGPLIVAWFNVIISASGGMAGDLLLGGLPAASAAGSGEALSATLGDYVGITLDSGYTQLTLLIAPSQVAATFNENGSNKSAQAVPLANVGAAVNISGTLIYLAAQPTA